MGICLRSRISLVRFSGKVEICLTKRNKTRRLRIIENLILRKDFFFCFCFFFHQNYCLYFVKTLFTSGFSAGKTADAPAKRNFLKTFDQNSYAAQQSERPWFWRKDLHLMWNFCIRETKYFVLQDWVDPVALYSLRDTFSLHFFLFIYLYFFKGIYTLLHHTKFDLYPNVYKFSYPPEVFPVGLFGNIIFGVYFSLQGTKTSPLWDVFFAEHTCHLKQKGINHEGSIHWETSLHCERVAHQVVLVFQEVRSRDEKENHFCYA